MSVTAAAPRRWRRPPLIASPLLRWLALAGTVAYLVFALLDMEFDYARFVSGIPRGVDMLASMVPPDFSRWRLLLDGLLESLQMAFFATAIGVVLSIPIAVGAATNVAPRWLYAVCRAYIGLSRTFPEVLIAIFFVKAFGFGAFAGVLTLVIASTGFVGKLLAEEIEAIDPGQVEAMRATGAGPLGVLLFGVAPQVMPRYIGLVIYRLDINLRESTILGIVGAGGVGAVLYNSFARYEYDFSLAILLAIIAVVLVAEWFSGFVRARIK
ncbi:phosphonate ABC transporter, permease protein PhnE [Sediminicurvatus halobius]|uniref:Phosphonate ABC transporter, permease protein PhnE n=1 Tax=Sediminicurvatus halobius TaxID=2182432 RepID=A0A2U2N7F7_9GAMM|nr:phosphonate ABC transporter, permease protein PhnE [Spiribacter halobius]PWG65111.1 phosphonate ABC transporter, permease protein PhnE [Spiribacter halobius]UEX78939.1 phosphonate ABC transporter, permease protein PhnE [Spiribacter halobius]